MNRNLKTGLVIIGFLFIMMLVSIFWTPYNPNKIHEGKLLLAPCSEFLLGTDYLGRDILSRVMVASQNAFMIGTATLLISGGIGVTIGVLAGYFSGKLGELLMRIMDMLNSIPSTILILVFIATFGVGLVQTLVAISFTQVAYFARIVRSKVLSISSSQYVTWAKSVGVKRSRILIHHIMPHLIPTILVISALQFSGAIMSEAALSYLGLGIQPPDASWGNILSRSQGYILTNPLYALIPGVLITSMVIGFNLISDGLSTFFQIKD